MTFYQKTVGRQTPDIGRWSPDCRPIINVSLYMCYIVYNACIHINYEIYHAFISFWDSFHLTSCTSNTRLLFVLDFQLNSSCDFSKSTLVLRLNDCYLILDILLLNILWYMWIELSVWSLEIKVSTSSDIKSNSKHSLIYVALLEHQTHNLTIEMLA